MLCTADEQLLKLQKEAEANRLHPDTDPVAFVVAHRVRTAKQWIDSVDQIMNDLKVSLWSLWLWHAVQIQFAADPIGKHGGPLCACNGGRHAQTVCKAWRCLVRIAKQRHDSMHPMMIALHINHKVTL